MIGIDYGRGLSNIDTSTGIRYGVISLHTPNPDAVSDIYTNGDNLTYVHCVEHAQTDIRRALESTLDDLGVLPSVPSYREPTADETAKCDARIAAVVNAVWNEIVDDWNDQYESGGEDTYRLTDGNLIVETSTLGLYVIKSDFYTLAAFCSPCCPGAGDLNTPHANGVKTYCLGPDWFNDDSPCPYPVYRVDTDELVQSCAK